MLTVIAALALWVGSIPLIFSYEISNSPANNPAIQGEAGLWSVLGRRSESLSSLSTFKTAAHALRAQRSHENLFPLERQFSNQNYG
jgi:hypothetical protein